MKDLIQARLEIASMSCSDPVQRAQIDAERAYHFARVGNFQEARGLLTDIRALPKSQFAPPVAIWVMLSEGIVEFFEDLDPHAHDRFIRAYALSVAIGDFGLQALTSAWLAHIEFNQRNYPAMVQSANRCFEVYARGNSSAHSRIFMVLANANLYSGNVTRANNHFEQARVIAVRDGDRATVGAIVYNRAALMLNNFRLQAHVDIGESIDLGLVSVAVESSSSFQGITDNRSLAELPIMSEARLAMIKGDFLSAITSIERVRSSKHRHRGGAKDPLLDIEYAVCLASSGATERAKSIVEGIDCLRYTDLDNDDQIVFLMQLISLRDQYGICSSLQDPEVSMANAKQRFSDELSRLRGAVASIDVGSVD